LSQKIKNIIRFTVFLGIGIFFIWIFLHNLTAEQKQEIIHSMGNANYWWIAMAIPLGILSHYLRALRWKMLIETMGYKPGNRNMFFAVMIGYFANLALPRLGEVSRCTILTKYENVPFQKSFGTVITDRVLDLLVFVLLFSLGNLIQIPGWLFLAAAVLALGRGPGGMVTYVAASVSCVMTFLVIRFVGGDALRRMDNRVATYLLGRLDERPVASIVVLRMLFQTVPALNYTLAMSGVRLRPYLMGTLLGLPLPILLYCLFFDYLAKALKLL
jgi:uncharacterized membrane protein YdjX (TVP38/TMEM64 family)